MPDVSNDKKKYLIEELISGTEQLLFSFIVPSTFCSTDNINELQKLVTQGRYQVRLSYFKAHYYISGCNKLQRKLLFGDSLAKLPYKIGAIRGILTNLMNALEQIEEKNAKGIMQGQDVGHAFNYFNELQDSTAGLCRSIWILPNFKLSSTSPEDRVVCLYWQWTYKKVVTFCK